MVSGVEEIVRCTYRLRPGAVAERALLEEWHRCRFLWNEAVHQQRTGRKPTFGTLSKLLAAARGRSGWLRAVSLPAYTTMTCSSCFARTKQRLGLAERIFRCRDCGNVADRDRNAARTILALAERGQTGVDGVSHAAASPPGVAVAVRPELQIPRL
jgi:ribosomal protein L37AE/L43A